MNIKSLLFASLTCSVFAASVLRAEEAKPAVAHEETELEGKMDAVGGAFKKLRKQVEDASKNEESLKLVAKMRGAAEQAVKLIPAMAADIPEADRAKFVADYQAKMKAFIGGIGKLEAALVAGKNDEAKVLLADLNAMQKDGHKNFRRPDKK